MFGTNNDRATWVEIGEPVSTCAFHREEEGDAPDTWIYVDPVTLYSQRPTLAALAYLSRPSLPEVSGGANPASAMCTELGGASAFGPSASGGGYVLEGTDSIEVFLPCTFADGSFIEEWGIAYYGAGTVRGQDLAPLFNFDIDAVPPVFG